VARAASASFTSARCALAISPPKQLGPFAPVGKPYFLAPLLVWRVWWWLVPLTGFIKVLTSVPLFQPMTVWSLAVESHLGWSRTHLSPAFIPYPGRRRHHEPCRGLPHRMGICASTLVPKPCLLFTFNVPPSSLARCSILFSPNPPCWVTRAALMRSNP
jgi:hypothetical protein